MAATARVGVAMAFLTTFAFAQDPSCEITIDGTNTKYNLKQLETPSNNPYRFYSGSDVFKVNFCGAAACMTMGAPATPGCKQPASGQDGQSETAIGAYQGFAKAELLSSDIQDVNFKTKGNPQFDLGAKGIKLYYYPPGQQGSNNGMQQPGGQQQMPQQQQPGFGPQNGLPGTPPPPPADPWGRRLMQWGDQPAQQQPQQPQQPGQSGYGGYQQVSTSTKPMTVFVICNADMTGQLPKPVTFAPGFEYTTRNPGYLFVVEHSSGCPVTENFIERAAGGLGWGWTFIICLSVLIVLYCGCGIFYKTKKLGVTGIEAIPNIEFWRDYPSIVKEGCGYSMATVLNCVGKGTGGGYSTV